jgi:hypothetical protein
MKGGDMRKSKKEWDKFVKAWIYLLKEVTYSQDEHIRFKVNRIVSILAEEEEESMYEFNRHFDEIAASNAFREL